MRTINKTILLTALLASCHPVPAQVQIQVAPYGEAGNPYQPHESNRGQRTGSYRSDGQGGFWGSGGAYGQDYRSDGFGGWNGSGSQSTGQVIRSDGFGGYNNFDFSTEDIQ